MSIIPKKIHYCWIGGTEKPESVQFCINSWKKYCPDYEIIEWNESNYDFSKNQYMSQAYKEKRWAFVSDYMRLDVIYNYGGIYLDTDVEAISNFDCLLNNEVFFGFENTGTELITVNTGHGFGSVANNATIKRMLEFYNDLSFYKDDGTLNIQPSPYYTTQCLIQEGLCLRNEDQIVRNVRIYKSDVLCPKNYRTKKTQITNRTVSIHHFNASWLSEQEKAKRRLARHIDYIKHIPNMVLRKILGNEIYGKFKEKFKK